jgi:hopanoid-associated phosphorylase
MIETLAGDDGPILAVTGMAQEARIAAAAGLVTVCSGGNPVRLREQLAATAPVFRAVVSFGVGGGLDPAMRTGDVVVATSVLSGTRRWQTDRTITEMLAASWGLQRDDLYHAILVGAEELVMDVEAKTALRAATGASAVDMESHVAAEFAAAHNLPLAALRVICDPADRSLPPLAREALGPHGRIDLRAVVRSLARRPAQVASLAYAARDFATALAALRRCGPLFGSVPLLPDAGKLALDVA